MQLGQNFPNPFSDATTIRLPVIRGIGDAGGVLKSFKVYDLLGRQVLDLSDRIDGGDVVIRREQLPAAGVYMYQLCDAHERRSGILIHTR